MTFSLKSNNADAALGCTHDYYMTYSLRQHFWLFTFVEISEFLISLFCIDISHCKYGEYQKCGSPKYMYLLQ